MKIPTAPRPIQEGRLPENSDELIITLHQELERMRAQLTLFNRKLELLVGIIEMVRGKEDPTFKEHLNKQPCAHACQKDKKSVKEIPDTLINP